MVYIWKNQTAKEPHPHPPPPSPPAQMKETRPLWVHVVLFHWLEMNPISNCIDHHGRGMKCKDVFLLITMYFFSHQNKPK
jgi:hypothetical protein